MSKNNYVSRLRKARNFLLNVNISLIQNDLPHSLYVLRDEKLELAELLTELQDYLEKA